MYTHNPFLVIDAPAFYLRDTVNWGRVQRLFETPGREHVILGAEYRVQRLGLIVLGFASMQYAWGIRGVVWKLRGAAVAV